MARDLTTAEPSLRQILDMDTDKTSALATIPLIQELVPLFRSAGTKAEVGLAALVYSLAVTKVVTPDGQVRAKWELTSLTKDKEGEWIPLAATWADFCLTHLGLDPSTASRYKRIWGVFSRDLGFDHTDLARAGIHNLRMALPVVARMYPAIDLPLLQALGLRRSRCRRCGDDTALEGVEICPSCGEKYGPVPGGDPAAVALRLKQLKPEQEVDGIKVLPDLQPVLQDGKVVGWVVTPQVWIEGDLLVSYVGAWSIDIIPDDSPKDALGVRQRHSAAFHLWLRRRFG